MSAALLGVALCLVGCGRERAPSAETKPGPASSAPQPQRLREHRVEPIGLGLDRDYVELELAFGEERTAEVELVGPRASEARVTIKPPEQQGFELDVVPAAGGKADRLRFRVRGKEVGVHVGRVSFATGLDDPAELAVNYTWKVRGTLRVEPTNPLLDLGAPKPVVIDVRSTQPGFFVSAVDVREGPFVAWFEHGEEKGQYLVKVTPRAGEPASGARGAAGKLIIVSNDVTEPKKEIPLLGIGKPAP